MDAVEETSPAAISPSDGTCRLVESAVSVNPVAIGIRAYPSSSIDAPSRPSAIPGSSDICPGNSRRQKQSIISGSNWPAMRPTTDAVATARTFGNRSFSAMMPKKWSDRA